MFKKLWLGTMSIDTIALSAKGSKVSRADNELCRLRVAESIADFFSDPSKAYNNHTWRAIMRYHSKIFPDYPEWSIAQALDYVFNGGHATYSKKEIKEHVKSIIDPEIQEYLRKKEESKTISADTRLKPISQASELAPSKLIHDLYVVPERIGEITGLSDEQIRKFAYAKGMESLLCGPNNRRALNLAALIPLISASSGMEHLTVILWNYYAEIVNDLTHND